MKVRELMTRDPLVAEVPGHRRDVVRLLVKHSVSGLPVVKERTRRLAGVVTRTDLFAKPDEEQLALLMSRDPLTISPEADASDAARVFFSRRIHGLPVVVGDELVGVVSPTDLLRVTRAPGRTVEQFLTTRVVPIHEATPLPVVWATMRLTESHALPVMDDAARLVGIVVDSDLFKLSGVEETVGRHELGLNPDDEVEDASVRDIAPLYYARNVLDLPRRPVRDIMERKVVTTFLRSSAEEAALKMAKARVNQLPVIDAEDRLVGMLTDLDLMRAWWT